MPEEGFSPIQAKYESLRCLMCADAPCTCNCPSGVDARAFIRKIRFDNLEGAARLLKRANVLAASCARICPTGTLCCKSCLAEGLSHPIDISGLQRFVMDWERKTGMILPLPSKNDGAKIAIVGAGPAGLGCAAELSLLGHAVTVFEKDTLPGGVLRNVIPSFRLPPEVVDFEIEFLKKLGVEFITNHPIEKPETLLSEGYKAVFLATGLWKSAAGDMIGGDLENVYQALDVLKTVKRGETIDFGKRVVVIGGGDTAIDAARLARRAGAECFVLYRRTQREMPAYANEVDEAWNDGVEFYFRVIVRSVIGDEKVKGVRCVRIKWHTAKMQGMQQGYDVEGAEFTIACDSVVLAVGQEPLSNFNLRATPKGLLAVDKDTMMTSTPGIFAGGDVVFGGSTATRAVGLGRDAAGKINEYCERDYVS